MCVRKTANVIIFQCHSFGNTIVFCNMRLISPNVKYCFPSTSRMHDTLSLSSKKERKKNFSRIKNCLPRNNWFRKTRSFSEISSHSPAHFFKESSIQLAATRREWKRHFNLSWFTAFSKSHLFFFKQFYLTGF